MVPYINDCFSLEKNKIGFQENRAG